MHGREDTSGHAAGLLYEALSGRWSPKFCALADAGSMGFVHFQAGIRPAVAGLDVSISSDGSRAGRIMESCPLCDCRGAEAQKTTSRSFFHILSIG